MIINGDVEDNSNAELTSPNGMVVIKGKIVMKFANSTTVFGMTFYFLLKDKCSKVTIIAREGVIIGGKIGGQSQVL